MLYFRKTIVVSVLCHAALFSAFSFSFGPNAPLLKPARISFLGPVFSNKDLFRAPYIANINTPKEIFKSVNSAAALKNADKMGYLASKDYPKPQAAFGPEGKVSFSPKTSYDMAVFKKNKPVIMFYPQLPYHFMLYFKDRQMAHIELMFNIIPGEKRNSILLKRRISSGNLEADLLCRRYISRYLSREQMGFFWNRWQSVKIDLSPKNDQP